MPADVYWDVESARLVTGTKGERAMMTCAGSATSDFARVQGPIASSDTIDSFLLSRRTSFVVMAAVAFFLAVCLWAIVVGLGA
jgi:hypothetical protein